MTPALARTILGDELRRQAVEATLRVAPPTATEVQDWYASHASVQARAVRMKKKVSLVLAPADRDLRASRPAQTRHDRRASR